MGWPDTTTFLTYTDHAAHAEMKAEIEAQKKAEDGSKAKNQSRAF